MQICLIFCTMSGREKQRLETCQQYMDAQAETYKLRMP